MKTVFACSILILALAPAAFAVPMDYELRDVGSGDLLATMTFDPDLAVPTGPPGASSVTPTAWQWVELVPFDLTDGTPDVILINGVPTGFDVFAFRTEGDLIYQLDVEYFFGFDDGPWRVEITDGISFDILEETQGSYNYVLVPAPGNFVRGDVNQDTNLDSSDAVSLFMHLFTPGEGTECLDAADANDDGMVDIADGIFLISFFFRMGVPSPAPTGTCGVDPTDDMIGCDQFTACP